MGSLSPVGAAPRRSLRLHLRGRLALESAVLALVVTALAGWTSAALVRATLERDLDDDLAARVGASEREMAAVGRAVDDSLARLEAFLRTSDSPRLERFLLGQPDLEAAAPWMQLFRLDLLDVLTMDDRILSSGHDPARVGLPFPGVEAIPDGGHGFRTSRLDGDPEPLIVGRRGVRLGPRGVQLVGGIRLDAARLDGVAGDGAALLLTPDLHPWIGSSRSGEPDLARIAERIRAGVGDRPFRVGGTEADWSMRAVPLPDDAGWWLVAVDRAPLERLMRQLTRALLGLAAVVGVLAALVGLWIGRGISRPLHDLTHNLDAIAAGEADYGFHVRGQDEVQQIVSAFSRAHRALEQQRRRSVAAERVAAWREVARHVAHEVKNPLAPIRVTVENLLRARRQGSDRFDALFDDGMRTILEEVRQLSRMVGEFAEFARLPLPHPSPVDVERLIDSAIELYAVDSGADVVRRRGASGVPVQLDADQISRALKNVIGNAVDAMKDRDDHSAPMVLEIETRIDEDGLAIEVLDNGPGLTDEAARRLFEPYFTTKETGTGLGMALTYRIIVEHGGSIYAENREEGGARIVVRLPIEAAAVPGPPE